MLAALAAEDVILLTIDEALASRLLILDEREDRMLASVAVAYSLE